MPPAPARTRVPSLVAGLGALAAAALVVLAVVLLAPAVLEDVPARPPEACSQPDPTAPRSGAACVTPTAQRTYAAVVGRFGEPGGDGPIRSASCWSEHAWNPSSDHPAGRACDFFPTRAGRFADADERRAGWEVAGWLRDNADELGVRYVIWDGRIWTRGGGDRDGWGRPYTGGGVYDPQDATGGHFDHVHVSVR